MKGDTMVARWVDLSAEEMVYYSVALLVYYSVVLMDWYWVELCVDKTAAWMVLNWAAMTVGM